jgi:hypothetical protein
MACGMGFLGLVFASGWYFGDIYFDLKNESMQYTAWASTALSESKGLLFTNYLVGIVFLFAYVCLAVLLNYIFREKLSATIKHKLASPAVVGFLVFANMVVMLGFWYMGSIPLLVSIFIIWLAILIFPLPMFNVFVSLPKRIIVHVLAMKKLNHLFAALFFITCALFFTAIFPFLKLSSLQVSNDYMWVPEKTYLSEGLVDNNDYILRNGIGGLFRNDLIQSADDINISQYHHISLALTPTLQNYLTISPYKYEYVPALHALMIRTPILTGHDKEVLCAGASAKDCTAVNQYKTLIDEKMFRGGSNRKFIENNQYELAGQILAGHYFHHQYAMLGPINELVLGKNPATVIYLYGYGNTQVLTYIFDHVWHRLTFENFTFTLYSFYLLYFSLFIVCCYAIFRDVRYVSITTASAIGLFLLIGFELIRVAPGFNPLRHFTDLLILLSFYGYLYSKRFNVIYLALSIIFGLGAVYASKEFGLMMFAALMGATVIHVILCNRRYINFLILALGLAALLGVLDAQTASMAPNPMSWYSLLGVSVAPSSRLTDLLLLMIVFSCYVMLFIIYSERGRHHKPLYLCLYLFFYAQCLWIYYAWYTETGHLFSTSPIWLLLFVLMYRELSRIFLPEKYIKFILASFGVGAVLLLTAGSVKYFLKLSKYSRIFKSHFVYQWNFPGAHFQSTMDPAVFKESTNLMQAYSSGNAIYIISKYDNLLPYLAGKYSAMPYLELSTSLVTEGEVDSAANAILNASPRYLFVDSDIHSSNLGDIVDPASHLKKRLDMSGLSLGRVTVLNESKRVFRKVASQYRLIKSGYLVSVYEHI